ADEAEEAFAAALRSIDQPERGEAAESYRGSALSHWFDRLAASHQVVPELIDRLRRSGAVSRALDAVKHVQDPDWRASAIANAVRVLVHTDERDAALELMSEAAVSDDLQAEVFAEVALAAAATGDRAAASAALQRAREAAERALAERPDLERPLVPICDACAAIGDAEALEAAALLAERLHPEA